MERVYLINIEKDKNLVHLSNSKMSYVLEVIDGKYLVHRYCGQPIRKYRGTNKFQYFKRGFATKHESSIDHLAFDDFPFEYPSRGKGDFRIPAFTITQSNGIRHNELLFKEWKIIDTKPTLKGLPSTRDNLNSETLEIICEDDIAQVQVKMYYTIFDDLGIIARHQKIKNYGKDDVVINNAKSFSLELPAEEYDFLSLYGTHIHEANINRFPLHQGIQKIESARGTSSSQHQPFFALMNPNTNEDDGEVFAFHLIYSGSFVGEVEKDQFGNVRAQLGLNPENFEWKLSPNTEFETPEAVLNYSNNGLGGMSENFHALYKNNLMNPNFKERPILLNSWEGMYHDITLDKIETQTDLARDLGIELYVVDDGWFRLGSTSETAMGDWQVNKNKIPCGIQDLSKKIRSKGLKFGLWFEPEMVSEDSNLYAEHPEWALHVPGYSLTKGRNSYVLDYSNPKVVDYIISVFDSYLGNGDIDYIKWDMNRPLTEVNSNYLETDNKNEIWHRFVLGLYQVLESVTTKYPNVLIEGCSSGGARFDPGMLYYTPQIWTSDNTDAYSRTIIQNGYSLLYTPVMMGAHISEVPNHQTGRVSSLETRFRVSEFGNFGYELDLTKLTSEEIEAMKMQIKEVKNNRSLLQNGNFIRNHVPNDNYYSWTIVSENEDEFITMIFQKMFDPEKSHGLFRLKGLNPQNDYKETSSNNVYGGDELMNVGLSVPLEKADFYTHFFHFKKHND